MSREQAVQADVKPNVNAVLRAINAELQGTMRAAHTVEFHVNQKGNRYDITGGKALVVSWRMQSRIAKWAA